MIRKQNRITVYMEQVLVIWIEDQTSYNSPLSHSIIQSKAPTVFNYIKTEKGEEAAEENLQLTEVGS